MRDCKSKNENSPWHNLSYSIFYYGSDSSNLQRMGISLNGAIDVCLHSNEMLSTTT